MLSIDIFLDFDGSKQELPISTLVSLSFPHTHNHLSDFPLSPSHLKTPKFHSFHSFTLI